MPKKSDPPMTQAEQSKRFLDAARDIEAAGGLSPTEAENAMETLVQSVARPFKAAYLERQDDP